MSDDWEAQKQEVIASRREALRFFSNENKLEREKHVVRRLLVANEIEFQDEELCEAEEPADVNFRDCNFQVKEILNKGRRRYDEFKEALSKAENAQTWEDLFEPYSPRDLPASKILSLTLERAQSLADCKYGPQEVAALDLICYCNFDNACETVSDFDLPRESDFRSISVVSNRFCLVIYAGSTSSNFLSRSVGILRSSF